MIPNHKQAVEFLVESADDILQHVVIIRAVDGNRHSPTISPGSMNAIDRKVEAVPEF